MPQAVIEFALLVAGFYALYLGAEWLVRGASRLALAWGISSLVVGLTVVSYGTSMPELSVSLFAAIQGNPDIAVGNVVGSNLINTLVILGIAAVIKPIACHSGLIKRDIPTMIVVCAALGAVIWDLKITRIEGILFGVGAIAFTATSYFIGKRDAAAAKLLADDVDEDLPETGVEAKWWWNLGLVAVGIAIMVLGSRWLVDSSIYFARMAGISDLVVGLTVVALGTSAPELATTIVAARKGESDIAIGNVVGSNIYNVLLILGVTGAVMPMDVTPAVLHFDYPVMLGAVILVWPLAWTGRRISRLSGAVLLASYVAYTIVLYFKATGA